MPRASRAPAESELTHLQVLLRTYTRQLQTIEQQIAIFGPALAPVHLLAQRDWFEAERARALRRIQRLERKQVKRGEPAAPRADARVLNPTLPTGLLHLLSEGELPLVAVDLANPSAEEVVFVVASRIEERSFTRTDRIAVPAETTATLHQLPTLRPQAVAEGYEISRGVLQVRVSALRRGEEALLLMQSFEVSLLARDVLLWGSVRADGSIEDRSACVGAWVTPNERSIVSLLRQAAAYAPGGQLVGYQGDGTPDGRAAAARDQVRAIFEALKAHAAITYIHSPLSIGPGTQDIRQRINLPRDSLAYRQANCIDGAVLYASLIERAAMNPAIVIVPGHAFVGWETWGGSGEFEFLETTMTAGHPFDEAWRRGQEQFAATRPLLGRPLFDLRGFARLLKLPELRRDGILPME